MQPEPAKDVAGQDSYDGRPLYTNATQRASGLTWRQFLGAASRRVVCEDSTAGTLGGNGGERHLLSRAGLGGGEPASAEDVQTAVTAQLGPFVVLFG
jgi:hypothetical protein